MTAVAFKPDAPFTVDTATTVLAAVCPWCETPRRTDKVGYFVVHRARRVKGFGYLGRPRVYVAVDECPGAGERRGETKAANDT